MESLEALRRDLDHAHYLLEQEQKRTEYFRLSLGSVVSKKDEMREELAHTKYELDQARLKIASLL